MTHSLSGRHLDPFLATLHLRVHWKDGLLFIEPPHTHTSITKIYTRKWPSPIHFVHSLLTCPLFDGNREWKSVSNCTCNSSIKYTIIHTFPLCSWSRERERCWWQTSLLNCLNTRNNNNHHQHQHHQPKLARLVHISHVWFRFMPFRKQQKKKQKKTTTTPKNRFSVFEE